MTAALLQPLALRGVELPNRIVVSPMWLRPTCPDAICPDAIAPEPTVPATTAPDPRSKTPTVPLAMFRVAPKNPWMAPDATSPEATDPDWMPPELTLTGCQLKSSRRNWVPSGVPATPSWPEVIAPDAT